MQRQHQAAVQSQGRCREQAVAQKAGEAKVPAVLTQVAPSKRSAESRRRRQVKALQRPSDGAGSRRRRVPAVLTHAAPG